MTLSELIEGNKATNDNYMEDSAVIGLTERLTIPSQQSSTSNLNEDSSTVGNFLRKQAATNAALTADA